MRHVAERPGHPVAQRAVPATTSRSPSAAATRSSIPFSGTSLPANSTSGGSDSWPISAGRSRPFGTRRTSRAPSRRAAAASTLETHSTDRARPSTGRTSGTNARGRCSSSSTPDAPVLCSVTTNGRPDAEATKAPASQRVHELGRSSRAPERPRHRGEHRRRRPGPPPEVVRQAAAVGEPAVAVTRSRASTSISTPRARNRSTASATNRPA